MKKSLFLVIVILIFLFLQAIAQKGKSYELRSKDGNVILKVEAGPRIQWSVQHKGEQVIAPSPVSMNIGGQVLPSDVTSLGSPKPVNVSRTFNPVNYKKSVIKDEYAEVTFNFKNDIGIIFRVYNDAVAYRFITKKTGEITVNNEEASFNFTADHKAFIPYMQDYRDGKIFNCSFESLYTVQNISQFRKDSLAFLPVLIDIGNGKKAVILEADLEDYPGMFLDINQTRKGFRGVYAPYPLEVVQRNLNLVPVKRADYIARTNGTRNFPWRVVVISENDKDLLNQDIVQKLAAPPRIADYSWVEPGQVSWDWWNATNISRVDFRSGMNTATYKYYIDFASANKIRYIIIDAGWSQKGDLTKAIPAIDLQEVVDHGKQKGVGVVLWASWQDILKQMDLFFPFCEKLGVKGLKIDFIDRDDQVAVASTYNIAENAARHHLMVDYHGIYKPTGLQRTYPNVVGYEGVRGMENVKWANEDVPRYDVTIPYIRMMAGLMDYTPGAMRNSIRANFRPINSNPMSQGTRCHQLAMYIVYESPFQMLSDNPTVYMQEQECTDFIAIVPSTFDETVPLDGRVGEYAALARKKGTTWYAGAMTNWTPRELTLDLAFLGEGSYRAVIFRDGVNADRDATDYKKETINVTSKDKLQVKLMNGGGWAARFEKVE